MTCGRITTIEHAIYRDIFPFLLQISIRIILTRDIPHVLEGLSLFFLTLFPFIYTIVTSITYV